MRWVGRTNESANQKHQNNHKAASMNLGDGLADLVVAFSLMKKLLKRVNTATIHNLFFA
jgi:hypothetical protein